MIGRGRFGGAMLAVAIFLLSSAICHADQVPAQPGDLISQTPIAGAPEGASAWRVRYASQDEEGAPVEVTGVVFVPAGPAPKHGRDIVAWGRGTVGLAPVCAPSKTPKKMFENTPGLSAMLRQGWVVAASDFADPDSDRVHPYLVGLAEAHAMLDMVRATAKMPKAEAGKRYAMWGESEGAHAALWAAKLEPTYAPGLDLVAVAVAAPPTNLVANFAAIKSTGARALMTGYVSDSWSKIYDIPLASFANGFGRMVIHQLAKDCTRFDAAFTNTTLLILSRQVPHDLGEPWNTRSAENSIAPWRLKAPLLIAQGGKDDVVPESLTRDFASGSCKLGGNVRYIVDPDAGHLQISVTSTQATVDWLAARFAGGPAESDCAKLTG